MAKATALARARRVRQHPKPKPQSAQIGPDGPQHPGNRQLYDKRGRPDAGLRLHPHHATFNVATFCAALWSNFTLPLTLKHHTCLRDSNLRSDNGWPFTVNGKAHRIKVGGTFTVNSALSVRNLAREAEGIALCPDYAVSKDIETGRLVRILPEFPSATLDIHAVFLEKRHIPIRVIACLDFMSHQFRTGILG